MTTDTNTADALAELDSRKRAFDEIYRLMNLHGFQGIVYSVDEITVEMPSPAEDGWERQVLLEDLYETDAAKAHEIAEKILDDPEWHNLTDEILIRVTEDEGGPLPMATIFPDGEFAVGYPFA
jgi:hypothetical protein